MLFEIPAMGSAIDTPERDDRGNMRPWFRISTFSLRSIFALTTILCVLLAVHVLNSSRAAHQRRIADKIKSAKGTVYYDYEIERPFIATAGNPGRQHPPQGKSSIPSVLIDTFGTDYFHCIEAVGVVRGDFPIPGPDPELDARCHRAVLATTELPYVDLLIYHGIPQEELTLVSKMKSLDEIVFYRDVEERRLSYVVESTVTKVQLCGEVNDGHIHALSGAAGRLQLLKSGHAGVPTKLTDSGVKGICAFERLATLGLAGESVTDKGCKEFSRLRNLTELRVSFPNVRTGFPAIVNGKRLSKLHVLDMHLDQRAFEAIGDLSQLRTLWIETPGDPTSGEPRLDHMTPISDACVEEICSLKHLEDLCLEYDLSEAQLFKLLSSVDLKRVLVGGRPRRRYERRLNRTFQM